ncbi:hypothetical protein DICVIV_06565 [Dictyocaulus viviparus]|uniref:Uncharacterized protein n=1 Tax=Dictyocaulus viviparus TaxID=29172 RepID=A0A0D8XS63_DICVI|nr:hypothetical protein DICVIV_06565 [Dictyocaulus viviparus]
MLGVSRITQVKERIRSSDLRQRSKFGDAAVHAKIIAIFAALVLRKKYVNFYNVPRSIMSLKEKESCSEVKSNKTSRKSSWSDKARTRNRGKRWTSQEIKQKPDRNHRRLKRPASESSLQKFKEGRKKMRQLAKQLKGKMARNSISSGELRLKKLVTSSNESKARKSSSTGSIGVQMDTSTSEKYKMAAATSSVTSTAREPSERVV